MPLLNFILSLLAGLILHELGHLVAARLCGVRVSAIGIGWGRCVYQRTFRNTNCQLRLLPLGAFIQMDMTTFKQRPFEQQLFVLVAGIGVNLILAFFTWGSLFGVLNLGLAIGNLLPFYQQDGWKSAIVLSRRLLGRSPLVEWAITLSGGAMTIAVVISAVLTLKFN